MDDVDEWVAYVDESMRDSSYIMVASRFPSSVLSETREQVCRLPHPGGRFHWRDADGATRRRAVDVVAGLLGLHLVVIAARTQRRKQERARRLCLRRMLFELEHDGVVAVSLESRTPSLNARDLHVINRFSAQGIITAEPRVGFARPREEPLLWVPDIVAGAVNSDLGGFNGYVKAIDRLIERHTVMTP
jgi:hypothetical protein